MSQEQLLALENRVDALIRDHQRLKHALEQQALQHEKERSEWSREREAWARRHDKAKERLDFVIARLKEFEKTA